MLKSFFDRHTALFAWVAGGLLLAMWSFLSLQVLVRELWPVFGGEGLRATLAAYAGIGPGKERIFQYGILAACAAVGLAYLVFLRHPGRMKRTLLLTCIAPLFAASAVWLKAAHYYHEQGLRTYPFRIEIKQITNRRYTPLLTAYSPERRPPIGSFEGFARRLDATFETNKDGLREIWALPGDDHIKAVYYLNHVSALWAFGAPEGINAPGGCVTNNAVTGSLSRTKAGLEPEEKATFETYWRSPIGCCSDYTVFFFALLNRAGIENRVVYLSEGLAGLGHSLLEVRLDGKWWIMDANARIAANTSWEALPTMPRSQRINVYLFQHPGLNPANKDLYRADLGSFRRVLVSLIAARNVKFYRYVDGSSEQAFEAMLTENGS